MCLSYMAATNVGLPTAKTCMRSWITISEDLSNLFTEVSFSVIEVGNIAVELGVICTDLIQQNLDLLTIALGLVVLLKGVKCMFKTNCVSLKGESGLILVKGPISIGM